MDELRCSCGQQNPKGTVLCAACGNPLAESDDKQTTLNMRYEGAARRSQTYNKTFIDYIWNFFSSVKVGVWIIVILLAASSLGTIFPQEMYIPPSANPAEYYEDEYGVLGKIYYELGFHNLYKSWWYLLLMAALTVSLIIASADRFFPLYRSLKNQRVQKHLHFMKRQRLVSASEIKGATAFTQETLIEQLRKNKYNVKKDGSAILAEKGRFSRWGPYVNHIGLILFLIGGMLRFFPGLFVDEYLWIREGETEVIPGTNGKYYLENHQFLVEMYDEEHEVFRDAIENVGGVVKTYETTATLYMSDTERPAGATPELKELDSYQIRVNDPFKFDGFALYQVDYKLHEFTKMVFALEHDESGEEIGEFTVDLIQPENEYELENNYTVRLTDYFPNFYVNDDGIPSTQTRIPDNPAFIFEVDSPEQEENEVSFLSIGQNFSPESDRLYKISLSDLETKHVSGLTVRKDYTLPVLIAGGFIFMIGLVQGSYWTHRRIWVSQQQGQVILAAHTNKNWFGLKREVAEITAATGLEQPVDNKGDTLSSEGEESGNG